MVTIMQNFIEKVSSMLVAFEKWDYPEFVLKQEILRIFAVKFVDLSFIIMVS